MRRLFEKHPLGISLLIAFVIRSIAAFRNYGPYGHDDFINIIEPALRHLFLGTPAEVPNLRFEFFPYAFSCMMYPLYSLGVRRVDWLVSSAFFILSLISLTQIIAIHRIGRLLFSQRTGNALTLFSATWAIAPIFTNSADIAAPAYILITFAILHLIRSFPHQFAIEPAAAGSSETKSLILTGFYLSAAVLFRFSLAPVFAGLVVWVIYAEYRKPRLVQKISYICLGGAITTLIMITLELGSGRKPLSTVIAFVLENIQMHITTQSYGSMPWWTYIGISLLFPIPGISLVFWPFMLAQARRFAALYALFLAFLISHSVLAFKLDRYVIPMIPILMVILFGAIETYSGRRLIRYSYRIMLFVNALLIAPVALTMQQRAGVDGAIFAGSIKAPLFVSLIDPWRGSYFGLSATPPVFADSPEDIIKAASAKTYPEFYVYRFMYYTPGDLKLFAAAGYDCGLERAFKPDPLEKLAIILNPTMNGRRNDTSIYRCRRLKAQ